MASSTWEGSREPDVQADPLRTADSFHIQHDQKGLSLHELEAEVGIVRQSVGAVSIQTAVGNLCQHALDQIISAVSLSFAVRSSMLLMARSTCFAKTYDTRNILCTGTALSLLCSAVNKASDLHTFTDI